MRVPVFTLLLSLLGFASPSVAQTAPPSTKRSSAAAAIKPVARSTASRAFSKLLAKEGKWRLKDGDVRVTLEPVANRSVLLERWTTSSGKTSLTVYHLDGDRLLATHYCPQGNQPRLALTSFQKGVLRFAFADGTNLKPAASRLHSLRIDVTGDDFVKVETYQDDKESETTTLTFNKAMP